MRTSDGDVAVGFLLFGLAMVMIVRVVRMVIAVVKWREVRTPPPNRFTSIRGGPKLTDFPF